MGRAGEGLGGRGRGEGVEGVMWRWVFRRQMSGLNFHHRHKPMTKGRKENVRKRDAAKVEALAKMRGQTQLTAGHPTQKFAMRVLKAAGARARVDAYVVKQVRAALPPFEG